MLKLYTVFLTLIFITLRLCHQIDWSWWLIVSPSFGLAAGYLLGVLLSWWADRNMTDAERFRVRYHERLNRGLPNRFDR